MNVPTFPFINTTYLIKSEVGNYEWDVFPKHINITAKIIGKLSVNKFKIT